MLANGNTAIDGLVASGSAARSSAAAGFECRRAGDQQTIADGADDAAAEFLDRRVSELFAVGLHGCQRARLIGAHQTVNNRPHPTTRSPQACVLFSPAWQKFSGSNAVNPCAGPCSAELINLVFSVFTRLTGHLQS